MSEEKNLEVFNEYVQKFTECKSEEEVEELHKCYGFRDSMYYNLYENLESKCEDTSYFYPFEYDTDLSTLQRVETPRKYIHIKIGNGLSHRVLEPIKKMPKANCDILVPCVHRDVGYETWYLDPSLRNHQRHMKHVIENTGYYLVGEEEDCAKFTKSLLRPNIETFE